MRNKFLDYTGLSYLISKIKGELDTKQDTLVSSENIKTISDNSILGSGDLDVVDCLDKASNQDIDNIFNSEGE